VRGKKKGAKGEALGTQPRRNRSNSTADIYGSGKQNLRNLAVVCEQKKAKKRGEPRL
jgi:hypothetical protein